jgi:hypothetical protein
VSDSEEPAFARLVFQWFPHREPRHIIEPMSLDPTWLFLSLIPGGLGFVLFVYGKKQERWSLAVGGLLFMVYPYFTDTVPALVGVGVLLGVLLWTAVRIGW